jgi:hypothetical protein
LPFVPPLRLAADRKEILEAAGVVRVELTVFGRPVPVEQGYDELEQA